MSVGLFMTLFWIVMSIFILVGIIELAVLAAIVLSIRPKK